MNSVELNAATSAVTKSSFSIAMWFLIYQWRSACVGTITLSAKREREKSIGFNPTFAEFAAGMSALPR